MKNSQKLKKKYLMKKNNHRRIMNQNKVKINKKRKKRKIIQVMNLAQVN